MKRKVFYCLLFLFPVLLQAQEEKDSIPAEKVILQGDLLVGQDLDIGKAKVKFLNVVSDSRCPRDVTCIWPGEAKVLLGVTVGGKYVEKQIVVSGGANPLADFVNLSLDLTHLAPYPETGKPIPAGDYVLTYTASVVTENQ